MKKILIIIALSFGAAAYGQDSIVTNLNIKAYVINTIAATLQRSDDIQHFNSFVKYLSDYRDGTIPTGSNNVNIDTIYTRTLVYIYSMLRYNSFTQDAFNDFASDITSKRNTNSTLDGACDQIDASFTSEVNAIRSRGVAILTGKNQ